MTKVTTFSKTTHSTVITPERGRGLAGGVWHNIACNRSDLAQASVGGNLYYIVFPFDVYIFKRRFF